MYKNILIGSGLSSLGFLENLNKDITFDIYDKNSYIGGHAYSHKIEDYYFDEGAHISHTKNDQFLTYINLEQNKKNYNLFKSNVVNFYQGKKIGYPIQLNLKDLTFKEKVLYLIDHFKKYQKKT